MNGDAVVDAPWKKGDEVSPKAQVLRSLGKLVRGLSTLFWSLPLMLIVYIETAKTDWLLNFGTAGMVPAIAVSLVLWWSLTQLRHFQTQERIWLQAVDRAELFAMTNVGLSPFLFWFHRVPNEPTYQWSVAILALSSVLLLVQLNRVLQRLAAMLPDETLRAETKMFAGFNTWLVAALLLTVAIYYGLDRMYSLPSWVDRALDFLNEHGPWMILFVVLIPLAMTMALIWKTKELIFTSVFNGEH